MAGELTTARLVLRRWRDEDAEPMAAINRDAEVSRFLNRPTDERAVAAFHRVVTEHWDRHGYGFYAIESRAGDLRGRLIGFAGVAHPEFLPDLAERPEIGWRLARDAWGHGYATEAARAVRDEAFGPLGLEELIAIIHPENERSRRLATGLGMEVEQKVLNPVLGIDVEVWHAVSSAAARP